MESFEQRLAALEESVYGGSGEGSSSSTSASVQSALDGLVMELQGRWKGLLANRGPELRAVVEGVRAHSRIASDYGGQLSNEANLVLLASSEGFVQETARDLAVIEAHQTYINAAHTAEDAEKHHAALARLVPVHLTQKEQAIWLNEQIDAVLQSNHDVVFALSSQLLRIDAILAHLEKEKRHA